MNTDTKTLLQNAARAIGYRIHVWHLDENDDEIGCTCSHPGKNLPKFNWLPATNSGDSRDLQVRLKISLETSGTGWIASKYDGAGRTLGFVGPDPNMAVLIVASKLGKQMKEENENDTQ